MPTYEYKCSACGHTFEREQAITEDSVRECPLCRSPVHRLISGGSGFILKGRGTDRIGQQERGCPLASEGETCCGREERCGKSLCGGEE